MEQKIDFNTIYKELKRIERVMITKEQMNKLLETIATMTNEETMNQIENSEKDIREGKIREINSVEDI